MEPKERGQTAVHIQARELTTAHTRAYLRIMRRLKNSDGVLRYGEIAKNRTDERLLAALTEAGEIEKIGFGCYAAPQSELPAQIAQRFKAKLTCISAVEFGGMRTLSPPEGIHIAVERNRGLELPRDLIETTVVHRESKSWLNEKSESKQYRLTSDGFKETKLIAPWSAVFARVAICQPFYSAVVAIDSGLAQKLTSKERILNLIPRFRYPDAVRAVQLASGTSQSVLESIARVKLVLAGFKVAAQQEIKEVGSVDLVVEDTVVVELDGYAYHADRKQFRKDRARDRILVQKGYRVLRYAFEDVIQSPETLVHDVHRLLADS